jgi:Pro-kumamolisin, activation domain/Subtilase family
MLLGVLAVTAFAAEPARLAGHVPPAVKSGKLAALGRLPATNELRLALGLPLRHRDELTNLLAALYQPGGAEFHHYLTPAEFTARFGPTEKDYAAVLDFARVHGLKVSGTHPNRTLVDVTARVADIEQTFGIRLQRYRHPHEAREFFAPDAEPLAAVAGLQSISGLNDYARPHPNVRVQDGALPAAARPQAGSGPGYTYMGNDFRRAYVPGTALTGAGQNVGLLQFDGFYAADITNYANAIGLSNNAPNVVVVDVNGGVTTPGSGNIEVALDIEMVLSMAPGVSNIYVYEAPNGSPWVDLLDAMVTNTAVQQFSCSWGGGGPDAASEQVFLQMAAQGQSFFNASGDADAFTGAVDFPADSPNITQVGGTTLTTDAGGNYLSETAWNRGNGIGTGGGISPTVTVPAWQLGVDMTLNHGSTERRNIPDVALTAENVYVKYGNGNATPVGGTSCAAPLWAGMAALINQQAAQAGQPPAGFLNPALYALGRGNNYAAALHDIVTGNNTNTASPNNYPAVAGYDLCTGWGTPNGTNFINALTPPDALGILPGISLVIYGAVGGPFDHDTVQLTLTNAGLSSLSWALGGAPAWLTVSPASGTLAAAGTETIYLTLVAPENFPEGVRRAGLEITNLNSGNVPTAAVTVNTGQSIVVNGGFETGDFTGWTLVGDTVVWYWTGSWNYLVYNAVATDADFPGVVHSGTYGAFLGEGGYDATLSQTLPTLPGQRYLVSCWLDNPASGGGQEFYLAWDGTNRVSLPSPPAFGWTNLQFTATATATNTVLQVAARNDPNYFGFDDVSVTPVPAVTFAGMVKATNGFQLSWNALGGLNYEVQYKTNLAQPAWVDYAAVTATNHLAVFTDTNGTDAGQRFYRLGLLP